MEDARVVRLEIPSAPQFVSVARKTLEAIASVVGLEKQEIQDLELAVGEACTNAVKYGDPGDQAIQIIYRIERSSVEIEVRNKGKAFTPPTSPKPVEQLQIGGLGLFLIDQVMDRLSIDCQAGETTLKMVKQIAKAK